MPLVRENSARKSKGRWLFDGRDASGKRVQKYFAVKAEADAFKILFDAEKISGGRFVERNVRAPNTNILETTIGSAVNKYLTVVTKAEKSDRTQKQDKIYLKRLYDYFYDVVGITYVHEIRPEDVMQFRASRIKSVAAATVNREFATIKPFLKFCREMRYTSEEFTIRRVAEPPSKPKAWTDEQHETFDSAVPLWVADVLNALELTGVRPCQIEEMKFRDIDFENRTFRVEEKKGKSWREEIRPAAQEFLDLVAKRRDAARKKFRSRPEDLVFLNSKGKPVNAGNLGQAIRKVRNEIGLPKHTAYGLRHKFGTDLCETAGIRTAQKLMGHSKSTTTERYTEPRDATLRDAIDGRSNVRRLADQRAKQESIG